MDKRQKRKPTIHKEITKFSTPDRQEIKYWTVGIGMYSGSRGYDPIPRYTKECCWWDRHPFTFHPIGCPVNYHDHKTKGIEYDRVMEKLKEMNVNTESNDFFETEGIFCSLSCAKAYAIDELQRTKECKYKNSIGLLTLLCQKVHKDIIEIIPAPSWKMLVNYGGPFSIDEFRKKSVRYEETINVKRPCMYSSFAYIKEKRRQ